MNIKKLLCLVLALTVCLSALALAEGDDLQAKLDEANARIEALQAEVELYRPYYERQIVAEYGDGGIIWRDDAMKEYEAAASYYAQNGMSIDAYADSIKQSILEMLVQQAVLDAKAAELGLDQMTDEQRAALEAESAANFETYIDTYKTYFATEGASDEEAREQTIAAMAEYGVTQESLLEQMLKSYADEQLHTYVTGDVAVTDEEVKAEYDAMVADDESSYTDNDTAYNRARSSGATIAWNPEGYRAVKHVLIKFDDEQNTQFTTLQNTLKSLNDELAALDKPAEEKAEGDADAEPTEGDADAEPTEAPRSREEIQAEIGRIGAEKEALYSQLLPQAQQVIDEFNGGADFDSLIEKYNADPGMQNEPTATEGYAVAADSTAWDPAFTEGAMSIGAVGQISAPVYGMYGIHVIYYLKDITPGPVPFEDLEETVRSNALSQKVNQTYNDQVNAWVEEANPVYHTDRF